MPTATPDPGPAAGTGPGTGPSPGPPAVPTAFVLAHTRPARPTLVPEVTLHVAADVVALWEAMEQERVGPVDEPPFWAAAWPGGQALARYVLDHPEVVAGRSVLDLGTGSGLVALASVRAGARSVLASDPDPYSATAVAVNARTNGAGPIAVVGDLLDQDPPEVDVVLAGDVCYDRAMSERVLPFLGRAWLAGAAVFLGDPGRPYLPSEGLVPAAVYDVPDTEGPLVRPTTVWRLP